MASKDTSGLFDQKIFEERLLEGKKYLTRNEFYDNFDFEGYFSYKVDIKYN